MMAQSRAESTRDTYNYGQYINQFPPNTIKVIREFERIQKKICRHKMFIIFNEICINEEILPKYIYIYIYMYIIWSGLVWLGIMTLVIQWQILFKDIYIYIEYISFGLVKFYNVSTIVRNLMQNPLYTCIY